MSRVLYLCYCVACVAVITDHLMFNCRFLTSTTVTTYTIREPQSIQYLKSVLFEILNVTTWSVFENQVTNNEILLKAENIHKIEKIKTN